MLTTIIVAAAALLVGWATPQPTWAKVLTELIKKKWAELTAPKSS